MTEVQQVEKQIQELEKLIKFGEALERLTSNRDFKEVILDKFMIEECALNAQNSVNMALTQDQRNDCLSLAQSAGYLKQFLQITSQRCTKAMHDIEDARQHYNNLLSGAYDNLEGDE